MAVNLVHRHRAHGETKRCDSDAGGGVVTRETRAVRAAYDSGGYRDSDADRGLNGEQS